MEKANLSFGIIGGVEFSSRCANALFGEGIDLKFVVALEEQLFNFANSNQITRFSSLDQFLESGLPNVDYILGVGLLEALPKWLMKKVNYSIICYYDGIIDGELTNYNPALSILNNKQTHGVTWYQLTDVPEKSDVLFESDFPISPKDTTAEIIRRCENDAIIGLQQIIANLKFGVNTSPIKKSVETRFRKSPMLLQDAGLLNWEREARDLEVSCRALDFEHYLNLLGSMKLFTNRGVYIVDKVSSHLSKSQTLPGIIEKITPTSIQVACRKGRLEIKGLRNLQGVKVEIRNFIKAEGFQVGDQLPIFGGEELTDFEEQHSVYIAEENNWVKKLNAINSVEFPVLVVADKKTKSSFPEMNITDDMVVRLQDTIGMSLDVGSLALTIIIIYLRRLLNQERFTFFINQSDRLRKGFDWHFASHILPFNYNSNETDTFIDLYNIVVDFRRKMNGAIGFLSDVYMRHPNLSAEFNALSSMGVVIGYGDNKNLFARQLGNKVGFLISEKSKKIYIVDKIALKKKSQQENLILQYTPDHLLSIIQSLIDMPTANIKQCSLMSEAEIKTLVSMRANDKKYVPPFENISAAFDAVVAKNSNQIALKFHNEEITYSELSQRSNQVANYLLKSGVKKNHIVAIYVERSIEMVVGMIGIIKSGAAYLPIHPEFPLSYVDYILGDAKPDLLLTTTQLETLTFGGLDLKIPIITIENALKYGKKGNPNVQIDPEDTLYVIYTSGSTGNPKGSMITHANVLSCIMANNRAFQFSKKDNWILFSSYCFDLSICELWGGLLFGSKVIIADALAVRNPAELVSLLVDEKITVLFLITTAFVNLSNHVIINNISGFSLKKILVGGEKLRGNAVKLWQEKFSGQSPQFYNLYGPTECTVLSTYRLLPSVIEDPDCEGSNIGIPCEDTQVYVMNENLQILPTGFPGELCIGGRGVGKGYLNREALTAERFVTNPYDNNRLYRTGDLVCMDRGGDIHFISRIDRQVKVRGLRIELDEININILAIPFVKFAETIAYTDRFDNQRLATFIIPKKEYLNNMAGITPDFQKKYSAHLRKHLIKVIPPYMLPGNFIFLDKFPYNHSGKICTKTLAEMANEMGKAHKVYGQSTQEILQQIWRKYLQKEPIRMHDNFLSLGGDSIIAIQIASEAAQFGIYVNTEWMFNHPTISELIEVVNKNKTRKVNQGIFHNRALYQPVREILNFPKISELDEATIDRYPLVPLQQGMLYHSIEKPKLVTYLQQIILDMSGNLDLDSFTKAWHYIIRRHSLLRSSYVFEDQPEMYQLIHENVDFDFRFIDWSDLDDEIYRSSLKEYIREDKLKSFDLTKPPLFRVALIRNSNNQLCFILTFHHIICDGWSITLLLKELFQAYNNFIDGRLPDLSFAVPFGVYYVWLYRKSADRAKQYWKSLIGNVDQVTHINIDTVTNEPEEYDVLALSFDKSTVRRIESFCKENHLTTNSLFQSAWALLLSKYSYSNSIIFGVTSSGRANYFQNIESIFGVLMHTLPMYLHIDPDQPVDQFIQEVHKQQQTSHQYFNCSLSDIHKLTDLPSGVPLFSYLYVFENQLNSEIMNAALPNFSINKMSVLANTHYPLSIIVFPGDQLKTKFIYLKSRFASRSIAQLTACFKNILIGLISQYHCNIGEISVLSKLDHNNLLGLYRNSSELQEINFTVDQLFELRAANNPHAIAAIFEGRCITYSELNIRANQFARYLESQGVLAGDKISVILPRDFSLLIVMMAIFKMGAVFVPIDSSYPVARNQLIIESCSPKLIVTNKQLSKPFKFSSQNIIRFDMVQSIYLNYSENDLGIPHEMNMNAYILYTSGSTGKPKGVCLTHLNAANFINSFLQLFSEDLLRGVLFSSSISFDLSILEIFGALCSGGRLHMVNTIAELPTVPYANNVTFINTVPSSMKLLLDNDGVPSSVKTLIITGDSFSTALIQDIIAKTSVENIYNGYGPTECGYVSFYKLNKANIQVNNIGVPISNVNFFVLDQTKSLCPVNVPGELFITGSCVASGYYKDDELTSKSFLPDFIHDDPDKRVYRTGDLVSWNEDGSLAFHGRIDHQVKIHGYRLELQEIENMLSLHPAIAEVVVLLKELNQNEKTLVVYFKPISLAAPPSYQELSDYLYNYLPGHMIPVSFVLIDNIPLTHNGKVDKASLLSMASLYKKIEKPYVEPTTKTQRVLVDIWSKILKIKTKDISIHDHFFDHGGHSLQLLGLVSIIHKQLSVKVGIHEIIQAPTINLLAEIIDNKLNQRFKNDIVQIVNPINSIVAIQPKGNLNPLFLVHPSGGEVYCYFSLANHLDNNRPVYAVQDSPTNEFASLEEMASHYINLIRNIQPEGPYRLGGYSSGGVIGWEMATQLLQLGQNVEYLALIDSRALLTDMIYDRDLFNQDMKEQLDEISEGLAHSSQMDLDAWLELSWNRLKLVMKYNPRRLNCHIALFKASISSGLGSHIEHAHNHWDSYTDTEIEVHLVPGSHSSMLNSENALCLANALNTSLSLVKKNKKHLKKRKAIID